MTKKLSEDIKKSRRPISRACTFCHSKHLQCDPGRPCQNCVKRGVAGSCENVERKQSTKSKIAKERKPRVKKEKFKIKTEIMPPILPSGGGGPAPRGPSGAHALPNPPQLSFINYTGGQQKKPNHVPTPILATSNVRETPLSVQVRQPEQHLFYNESAGSSRNNSTATNTPGSIKSGSIAQPLHGSPTAHFNSALNSEYTPSSFVATNDSDSSSSHDPEIKVVPSSISYHADTLDDVINKDDLNFMLNAYNQSLQESKAKFKSTMVDNEYAQLTSLLQTNPPSPSDFFDFDTNERAYIQLGETDPAGSEKQRGNFIHINTSHIANSPDNAVDYIQEEVDYIAPLVLRHVIKTPDDIYLTDIVKSYQYPNAYHALIGYLKQRFNRSQLLTIARCMAAYRPSFISATKSLFENDLIFTEKSFQRSLLEYENLISLSATPTIIWRRTGEITALTNEFSALTGYTRSNLLSKRTFIVELMDDESALRYFKLFSDIAFGDLNATILTDCVIKKSDPANGILKCACVWTIKRDVFDIPMLIVGQFLPII